MPSRPAFGSSLNPWVGNHSMYWSQLPSHYKTFMSARPMHLSGRFSPHDWQEIQRRDIPVPGISSGPLGTGKVVTAEDAYGHLEDAREAEELLRLQAVQQPVSSKPINLTELAGSSPLANLSLDPFAFTPDTRVEVPTIFANEGGAAMAGLGFRPLGYLDGGTVLNNPVNEDAPDTLEDQFLREVEKGKKFALAFARTYKNELMSMLQNDAFDRTQTAQIFAQMLGSGLLEGGPIGAGMDMPYPTFQNELYPAPTGERVPLGRLSDLDLKRGFSPSQPFQNELYPAPTGERVFREVEETVEPNLQNLQAGGHVGRGTMAGELGRRGDLSVRQAGETMFERMKRLRGYAGGGYADGYSAPRGTVAGELPRYGHMSVREEGESMGELHKRHQDQDWYNRMGGGLGSLGRRSGVA